jgi:lysophospholipase L1-like esterase
MYEAKKKRKHGAILSLAQRLEATRKMRTFHRYVAIGDSTTEGLEDRYPTGGYRGWANRLAAHLNDAFGDVAYANLAVRGLGAYQIKVTQLPKALAMNPDLVTVVAGVNDLLGVRFNVEAVGAQVAQMIEAFRERDATVLTFTMPDITRVNPITRLIRSRLEELNQCLRETCARTGALLLDLAASEVASDTRLWHEDRLHANALGHERTALGLAATLGLPTKRAWNEPLMNLPGPSLTQIIRREWHWSRTYLFPWMTRHALGQSSADGCVPKRPELERFDERA